MGVAAVKESRVLCNFDGSFDQVSTIAHELGCAFAPARKPGKLPAEAWTASYALEYGENALELAHTVIKEICAAQLDLQQKAGKPKWYDAGVDAELDAKYGGLFDAKISEHVMHCNWSWSAALLPRIIAGYRARGYRFVTVTRLLGLDPTPSPTPSSA